MAPSSEYHKQSHSRSEILGFSCALKNAGSVYYRRYTIWTINRLLENDSGSFSSRSQRRLSYYYYSLLTCILHIRCMGCCNSLSVATKLRRPALCAFVFGGGVTSQSVMSTDGKEIPRKALKKYDTCVIWSCFAIASQASLAVCF